MFRAVANPGRPVQFVGDENLVFYINGVPWQVGKGVKCQLPARVFDYYMENKLERMRAESREDVKAWLFHVTGGKAIAD